LEQVVWENYIDAMKLAGFNPDQGLYIASGLLTYGASEGEKSHMFLEQCDRCEELIFGRYRMRMDCMDP